MLGAVGERRVQELRPRRAEQLQRVPCRLLGPGLRILERRNVRRQRVEAVGLHPLRVKLALARGRGEDPVGERCMIRRQIEPDRSLGLQSLERDPRERRPAVQSLADQGRRRRGTAPARSPCGPPTRGRRRCSSGTRPGERSCAGCTSPRGGRRSRADPRARAATWPAARCRRNPRYRWRKARGRP